MLSQTFLPSLRMILSLTVLCLGVFMGMQFTGIVG